MCVINVNAEVSNTNIFVAPDIKKERQLTVYSNSVKNESRNNMMILPVPNPTSIRLIDLSNSPNFFKNVLQFHIKYQKYVLKSRLSSLSRKLQEYEVGSYNVCIANSIDLLDHINPNKFGTVTNTVKELFASTYDNNYGYVVCKLKEGDMEYHPLAYTHDILNGSLFIPTLHSHGENRESTLDGYENHWDHNIYIVGTELNDCNNIPTDERIIPKDVSFDTGPIKTFTKLNMKGRHKNKDLVYKLI